MTFVGTVGVHWRVGIMSRLEPQACIKFLLDPQSTLRTVIYDNDYEFIANFTESRRDGPLSMPVRIILLDLSTEHLHTTVSPLNGGDPELLPTPALLDHDELYTPNWEPKQILSTWSWFCHGDFSQPLKIS